MVNENSMMGARGFAVAFARAFGEAVARETGAFWPLEVTDTAERSAGQTMHFRLEVDGTLHGQCFIEFHEPQALALAAKILGRPPVNDEDPETLAKVILSAMPALSAALSPCHGDVRVGLDKVTEVPAANMFTVALASPADPSGAPVLLCFDGDLLAALSSAPDGKSVPAADKTSVDPANLHLVMDVELNVSLRFGQRQLPLREVLELSSGSVIELDRMVDEPVELLLDGKLVARGEAVIVDGNYGLRVTEIPRPVASHFLR